MIRLAVFLVAFAAVFQARAQGMLVYLSAGDQSDVARNVALIRDSLSAHAISFEQYRITDDRSIARHAAEVLEVIGHFRATSGTAKVLLLSERESNFVALDVLAKDSAIAGLISMDGIYEDGRDYLYSNISIRENMEHLDSISYDREKERSLQRIYGMLQDAGEGIEVSRPDDSDKYAAELYRLLQTSLGRSLTEYVLAERLSRIKSAIYLYFNIDSNDINSINLCTIGNRYGVNYTPFVPRDLISGCIQLLTDH